MQQANKFE